MEAHVPHYAARGGGDGISGVLLIGLPVDRGGVIVVVSGQLHLDYLAVFLQVGQAIGNLSGVGPLQCPVKLCSGN